MYRATLTFYDELSAQQRFVYILELVYKDIIHSILSVIVITWHGNISSKNTIKFARVVNAASTLVDKEQKHLSRIYNASLERKPTRILYDPAHHMNESFKKLPPGRRIKAPLARKNLFQEIVYTLSHFNCEC